MSSVITDLAAALQAKDAACRERDQLAAEMTRLRALLNTPELHDFASAVVREAAHQRERWGTAHDAGKTPPDWFWLLGYLGGKALQAAMVGDTDKALHHTISSAAALANWHAALSGSSTAMRPGIDPVARGIERGMRCDKCGRYEDGKRPCPNGDAHCPQQAFPQGVAAATGGPA